MAVDLGTGSSAVFAGPSPSFSTRAVTAPSVAAVRPGNNATNVARDVFIAADLNLPNGGLDKTTITGNVTLVRVSDGKVIAGSAGTSGGGDAITFTPHVTLDATTQYRFSVTAGVKDVSGTAITPFSSLFTTGTTGGNVNSAINFTKVQQAVTAGAQYTAVTVGPDGKLYAATFEGQIRRWSVGADGTLSNAEVINTVVANNGNAARTITGLVFAPSSTASNLVVFVTHTMRSDFAGQNFTGKLSKLSGPNLATYQDYLINLPRSNRDHLTNQAAFGPDGALYISQGASTAMGAPDSSWGNREESLLSAAILRLNVGAIDTRIANNQGALNVKTIDVGGPYNPYASGAPLTLFATGVRNAYDLVWAANGTLYAPVNGSAAGGNTPASSNTGMRPPSGTAYSGPVIPALTNVRETQHDRFIRVRQGNYYGHPNPSRGQFVLMGGNPTAGQDPQEVVSYPIGTLPDSNFKTELYDFGQSQSPNGIIQYKSNTFSGALKDKLLVVRYSGGDDILALTLNSSGLVDSSKTMTGIGGGIGAFTDPVDLIEYINPANAADPRNGMIFVAEYGGQRITLLRPTSGSTSPDPGGPGVGGPATVTSTSGAKIQLSRGALVFNAVRATTSPAANLVITNTGTSALNISGLTLGGTSAGLFTITNRGGLPASIAAGASVTVSVTFSPTSTTTLGISTATLTIASDDSARPSIAVPLRGLAHLGGGGQNEPSLQRVLDLYQMGVQTGDKNAGNTNLYSPTEPLNANEEVLVQTLVKATTGNVTIQPLATFAGGNPAVRFGYYAAGSASSKNELFTIATGQAQSVFQTPTGTTSFDPGGASFGIYATFPIFGNTAFSEDRLNSGEATSANRRKVRFYPLKDGAGAVIPNAYIFAAEDFFNDKTGGYDTNDFVGIIRNVKIATAGTGLTLENLDGVPFDDRISLSRIGIQPPEAQLDEETGLMYNPAPNVVHDTATLRLTNSSANPITINALTLSNASAWKIESGPTPGTTLAAGASVLLTVKFVATKAPATSTNETIDLTGRAKTFNGTYVNSLTISSTDPVTPNRTIQLAGYFQYKNEKDQEPNLPTLVNRIFGYTTKILNTGQALNTGGKVQAVGEEIISDYWRKADANAPVSIRQLAAYHTQGDTGTLSWYSKTTKALKTLIVHNGVEAQSLLPNNTSGTAGAATFNPDGDFAFKVDMEWSVPSFNKQEQPGGGYGHHIRLFPARDRNGLLIPDTYIMGMDYLSKNFDYQDNVYLISNIKAANGLVPNPDPTTPGAPTLAGLNLINAATDTVISPFANGQTIDLTGGKQYTVQATPGTTAPASVVFAVDGVIVRTESTAPFTIAGEVGTDMSPWSVPLGTKTLTVTPYSGTGGTGTAGTPIVVTFTASDGTNPNPTLGVTGLVLVDAATNLDIGPLNSGATIDFSGGKQYSVRAVTATGTKSVTFTLDGAAVRTESAAPFTIAGDTGQPPSTDYLPWTAPANGAHTLTVTGFGGTGGTGTVGSAVTVSFNVTGSTGGGTTVGAGNFTGINIGAPPVSGSVTAGGPGIWTVRGSGSGTGGTKDQHLFAQQTRNGDFDVKAKLVSLSSGVTGLTLRSGTSGGNSVVSLIFAAGNVLFCTRNGFGQPLEVAFAGTGTAGNIWLRMRRQGNTVTTFFSADGTNWTTAGSANVAGIIPTSALFGFMASNGNTLNTARFEQVTG